MQRVAIFILLTVVTTGNAWCRPPQTVAKPAGWTYFGRYQPPNPNSLANIPESIRLGVVAHLQTRLGDNFYRRLEFAGGQVVDIDELHRIEPNSMSYQWEVPAYDLHFTFHMPEIGLDSYTAQISLRKDGSVLREIDLPNFAEDPGKLNFTTLALALQTAKKKGFDPNKLSAHIAYDSKADALIWQLSEVSHDDGLGIQYNNMDIYVHSGAIAKIYKSEAIR